MADQAIRRSSRAVRKNPRYSYTPLDDPELEEALFVAQEDSDASSFEQEAVAAAEVEEEEDDLEEDEDPMDVEEEPEAELELEFDFDIDEDVGTGNQPRKRDRRRQRLHGERPVKRTRPVVLAEDLLSKEQVDELDDFIIGDETAPLADEQETKTPGKRMMSRKYAGFRDDGLRTRGILLHTSVMSKEITLGEITGYDKEFSEKLSIERGKYSATVTLPHRKTESSGRIGLSYPEIFSEEIRQSEREVFDQWYHQDKGQEFMAKVQATCPVDDQDKHLHAHQGLPNQTIFLGPYHAQQQFDLEYLESLSMSTAWQSATNEAGKARPGWILNLGARIIAMDWAPRPDSCFYQYLAISVAADYPEDLRKVSALEATESYESSIQIWAFRCRRSEQDTVLMDMEVKPRLVQVICGRWGLVRRLSWCPVTVLESSGKSIGILGFVSTDGHVRLIDVCIDMEATDPYVKYNGTAFHSKPPETICTSLTWLSTEQLAAGCGDGHVAIWNIRKCLQQAKDEIATAGQSSQAIPYWYFPLHTTFITSIVAHQPYPSQYIVTNGVDGRVRLTSIQHPHADTSHGSRERHLMPPLAYSPHVMGIMEIDEMDGLRARPLRHMSVSRSIAKAPSQVLYLDAGKVHPTLMFGCADGHAVLTNPIRRLLIRRITDEKVESWQQIWFKHEFVPSTRTGPVENMEAALEHDQLRKSHVLPRPGVSRFLESHRVETVMLMRKNPYGKENDKVGNDFVVDDGEGDGEREGEEDPTATPSTPKKSTARSRKKAKKLARPQEAGVGGFDEIQISLYEEEQAVTCISWNPNVQTGGWVSAGLANGLVRIEDLAI